MRNKIPESLKTAQTKDNLWMISHEVCPNITPLWVGWNSKNFNEVQNMQKIWYMSPINQSPTSDAVVAETMNKAVKVAEECGKKSISVTYDLAIAKKAMQIQTTEKPKYDVVFVNLAHFT